MYTALWYFISVHALQTQVSTVVWTQSICEAHGYGQAEANEKRRKWRSWTIQRGDYGSCKEHPHFQYLDFFLYFIYITPYRAMVLRCFGLPPLYIFNKVGTPFP